MEDKVNAHQRRRELRRLARENYLPEIKTSSARAVSIGEFFINWITQIYFDFLNLLVLKEKKDEQSQPAAETFSDDKQTPQITNPPEPESENEGEENQIMWYGYICPICDKSTESPKPIEYCEHCPDHPKAKGDMHYAFHKEMWDIIAQNLKNKKKKY